MIGRNARALLVVTVAALATGCTSSPKINSAGSASATPTPASASASPSPSGTGVSPGTPASGTASGTASGAASNGDLAVLATRRTAAGARTIQIDLNQVRVSGQVMEVTFTARNADASGGGSDRWQIADFFSNGIFDATGSFSSADADSVDGVYVVDTVNAKRYLVARDSNNVCVCSSNLASAFASPGQGVVLDATFRAPPDGVTTVNVSIPKAGTFAGVSVQR